MNFKALAIIVIVASFFFSTISLAQVTEPTPYRTYIKDGRGINFNFSNHTIFVNYTSIPLSVIVKVDGKIIEETERRESGSEIHWKTQDLQLVFGLISENSSKAEFYVSMMKEPIGLRDEVMDPFDIIPLDLIYTITIFFVIFSITVVVMIIYLAKKLKKHKR